MQHEQDRTEWDGAQVPLFGFDQLEHFTRKQFFYMLSRNRTTCGVNPYIRATCNPDPDHWLRDFMRWWIDDDSGLPIIERGGIIRWFIVVDENVHWADSPEDLTDSVGADVRPKSFTFIPGKVHDNKILLAKDPNYLANLEALSWVDRQRLLYGNWNARETAGSIFRREWFNVVGASPALVDTVRYWDRAATDAQNASKRSSWTAGVKMGLDGHGQYFVLDVVRFHGSPLDVENRIKNVASQDGRDTRVGIEQDPGQAGKAEALVHVRNLAGNNVLTNTVRESKGTRAKPLSAQVEAGNVQVVRGSWNDAYLREMENFDASDRCVADQVDASSGAFLLLTSVKRAGTWGR